MDSLTRDTLRKIETLRFNVHSFGHIFERNVERLIKSGPIEFVECIKSSVARMNRDLAFIKGSIAQLQNTDSASKLKSEPGDFFSISEESMRFANYIFDPHAETVDSIFECDKLQSHSDLFAEIQLHFQPSRQFTVRDFDVTFHTGTLAHQYIFKMTYPNLFYVSLEFTIQNGTLVAGPLQAFSTLEQEQEQEQEQVGEGDDQQVSTCKKKAIHSKFAIFTSLSRILQKHWDYEMLWHDLDGREMSLKAFTLMLEKLHDVMSIYDELFNSRCYLCSRTLYEDDRLNSVFSHLQISSERLPPLLRLYRQGSKWTGGLPTPIHSECYLRSFKESNIQLDCHDK